jgi:hypothetical protein
MDDCRKEDGVCMCRPDYCYSTTDPSFDCWTIKAENCNDDCKGCTYPYIGTPTATPSAAPVSTAKVCPSASPMNDCKVKNDVCMCKTNSCYLTPDPSYDCYDVKANSCTITNGQCSGCVYPYVPDC